MNYYYESFGGEVVDDVDAAEYVRRQIAEDAEVRQQMAKDGYSENDSDAELEEWFFSGNWCKYEVEEEE